MPSPVPRARTWASAKSATHSLSRARKSGRHRNFPVSFQFSAEMPRLVSSTSRSRTAARSASRRKARRAASASPRAGVPYSRFSASSPPLPPTFTLRQETLLSLRVVRRRDLHLPHRPASRPCDPGLRSLPRRHCRRASRSRRPIFRVHFARRCMLISSHAIRAPNFSTIFHNQLPSRYS